MVVRDNLVILAHELHTTLRNLQINLRSNVQHALAALCCVRALRYYSSTYWSTDSTVEVPDRNFNAGVLGAMC